MVQGSRRSVDGAGRVGAPESDLSFVPPDDLELKGDSGESLVKWKRDGDRVVITSMDGVSIGNDEDGQDSNSDDTQSSGGNMSAPGYES